MNIVPIVFAFDNNLAMPAAICVYSLLINAKETTVYDVYFLYPKEIILETKYLQKVFDLYSRHKARYISVGDDFDKAFQIRGINAVTYYRLLIPDLIPEYDKIIYSDVDVIFQDDLSEIYFNTKLEGKYIGAVNSLSYLYEDNKLYYTKRLKLDVTKIFYAGNIILNSKVIRDAGLKSIFMSMIEAKYKFQDMDILNITCHDKVEFLPPSFCVTTYFCDMVVNKYATISLVWTETEIREALSKGIIHYNGKKPWKGYCINFDIWWEYYRKSPVFDRQFYFDFFYNRLNELDSLTLWKRVKILVRYFVYGKGKNS